jgi:hypothetical protein
LQASAASNWPKSSLGEPTDATVGTEAFRAGTAKTPPMAAAGSRSGGIAMVATIRMVKATALVLALVFGVTLIHGAGAEEQPSSLPMELRVKDQRFACFSGEGRTFAEHYTYDANGAVESITTVCQGGSEDG